MDCPSAELLPTRKGRPNRPALAEYWQALEETAIGCSANDGFTANGELCAELAMANISPLQIFFLPPSSRRGKRRVLGLP